MATFKAIRIDKADKGTTAALAQFDEAELMDGDVTVAVAEPGSGSSREASVDRGRPAVTVTIGAGGAPAFDTAD